MAEICNDLIFAEGAEKFGHVTASKKKKTISLHSYRKLIIFESHIRARFVKSEMGLESFRFTKYYVNLIEIWCEFHLNFRELR